MRVNDLTPPKNLTHHKYINRVVIHPTSKQEFRSWQKKKFIKLAKKLQQLDYQPV